MVAIRPQDLSPVDGGIVNPDAAIIADVGYGVRKATPAQVVDAGAPVSSQAEAEAGVVNTGRMTPLRTKQAIDALAVSQDVLESSGGASLIGTPRGNTVAHELEGWVNLRDFGADANGSTDVWVAVDTALDAGYKMLRLPQINNETNTAYFGTFIPSALADVTLDIDPEITLSLPSNEPVSDIVAKLIGFVNPPKWYFRSLSTPYLANRSDQRIPHIYPSDADRSVTRRVMASALAPLKVAWPGSDAWVSDSFLDSSASSFAFGPTADASLHVGIGPCQPGDERALSFATNATSPNLLAVVRFVGGFAGVMALATYNSTVKAITKLTGVTGVEGDIGLVGPGTHETYSGLGALWSIRIDSWRHFTILWNGMKVRSYETPGDIVDCGFGMLPTAGSQVVSAQNQTRSFGAPWYSGQFIAIRSYGDSTLQERYDDLQTYIKRSLDTSCGIRNWSFVNRAVGGDGIAAQLTLMQADQLSGALAQANAVLLQVGDNDIQGLTDLAQFRTDFEDAIQLAHGVGANVIIGLPSLFYGIAQAGSRGQATVNYGRGAPYRSTILDLIGQYDRTPSNGSGPRCIAVNLPAMDGPMVANYVNSALSPNMTDSGDPVAYDSIHPTTEANERRAGAYARAVASMAVPYSGTLYRPLGDPGGTYDSGAGASGDPLMASISADGIVSLSGYITLTPATDDEIIYRFPRPFWPKKEMRVLRPFCSDLSDVAWLRLTTTGELYAYGFTASTYVFVNTLSGYCIEDREVL